MTQNASNRFVVLHHRVSEGLQRTDQDHFDWMFQNGSMLTTFASSVIDQWQAAFEVDCSRLADHRAEYLEFEGPIADRGEKINRGSVTRIKAGTFEITEQSLTVFSVLMTFDSATIVNAVVQFRRDDQHQWRLRFIPGR